MGGKPPMGPAPAGTGPAATPGAMAGNQRAGLEKVHIGLKALIDALPMLPLGSELQSEVMKAVQNVGKHMQQGGAGGDPAAIMQMLALMGREAKSGANPMQAGALQQMSPGGAPPGIGGAAPPPGG